MENYNPGFEIVHPSNPDRPAMWTDGPRWPGGGDYPIRVTDVKLSGDASIYFDLSIVTDGARYIENTEYRYQVIGDSMASEAEYTLGCWIKAEGVTGDGGRIRINDLEPGVIWNTPWVNGTTDWENSEGVFTSPTANFLADTPISRVDCMYHGNEGELWFDDLYLIPPVDEIPPSTVQNVTLDSKTWYSVTFSWDQATDNFGVIEYRILRDAMDPNNPDDVFATVGPSVTTFTDDDPLLTPSTSYTYYVVAYDANGNGSNLSDPLMVTTDPPDTEAPTVPAPVTEIETHDIILSFEWGASTDNYGVVAYNVYRTGGGEPCLFEITDSEQTQYTDDDVMPDTTYTYNVTAMDLAGNESDPSADYEVTTLTLDVTPPTAPGNLQAVFVGIDLVDLMWDASTDDRDVTGYFVYQDGIVDPIMILPPDQTAVTVDELTPATEYGFYVSAGDLTGNESAASNNITPKTKPKPQSGKNLLANPSFEVDMVPPYNYPDHWGYSDNYVWSMDEAVTGNYSLRTAEGASQDINQSVVNRLEPNLVYTWGAWIKTNLDPNTVRLGAQTRWAAGYAGGVIEGGWIKGMEGPSADWRWNGGTTQTPADGNYVWGARLDLRTLQGTRPPLFPGDPDGFASFDDAVVYVPSEADLSGDELMGVEEVAIIGTNWLKQSGATPEEGDYNGDGKIDYLDIAWLGMNW